MIKTIIIGLILTCITMILFAQTDTTATSKKWSEMKEVNPNLKETHAIRIFDDPKSVYQLEMKDNKPYNGYEISDEKLLGELNVVNYYQNGTLSAKYTVDYLQFDGTSAPVQYTLKTTYQDGKVIDGYVYRELPQNIVLIEQYKNAKQIGFLLDLFAMHYFNRLSFQLKDNLLSVNNLHTNNEIRIYKKNELLQADYYVGNKRIATSKKVIQKIDKIVPNASKLYYLDKDHTLQAFICLMNALIDLDEAEDDLLPVLFSQFSFEFKGDLTDVLKTFHSFFNQTNDIKKSDLASIFQSFIVPYDVASYLTALHYNAEGKAMYGTDIKEVDPDKYEVINYTDGKITSTAIIDDLNQLKKTD